MYLWIKSFHIIFMITWFAGLFYLPRLFVYHAMSEDEISNARFKIMERKLFFGIMTPGALITILLGLYLLQQLWPAYQTTNMLWLHIKLLLIAVLLVYHLYCGKFLYLFKQDKNPHSHIFYRWFNEFPVLLLIAIIVLVIVKPF